MSLTDDFLNLIKDADKKTSAYDTTAEVRRVESNTIWVHIAGGVDETPIEKTINAKAGDVVKVRVSNGRAWITGNSTAPPTDDAAAMMADKKAVAAVEKAENAEKVANDAHKIAGNTNQYFWHTESGTDTGAHITKIPQEEFLEDPENGGGNLLARSNGIAVRDGLEELSTFSADGVIIGKINSNKVSIDSDSIEMYTPDGVKTMDIASSGSVLSQPITEFYREPLTINEATDFTLFQTAVEPSAGTEIEVGLGLLFYNYVSLVDEFFIEKGTPSSGTSPNGLASYVYDGNLTLTLTALSSHVDFNYTYYSIDVDAPYYTLGTRQKDSANGAYSYAIGRELIALMDGQLVIGKFNKTTPNADVFIIGNGTSDNDRSNAFTVNRDGEVKANGDISANNIKGSQTEDCTGSFTVGNCTIFTGNVLVKVTAANTNTDVNVLFEDAFKYLPNVQVTMRNIGSNYYQKCTAASISKTGFTVRVRAGNAVGDVNVNWMAIGELA